jgi:hypothetical protein
MVNVLVPSITKKCENDARSKGQLSFNPRHSYYCMLSYNFEWRVNIWFFICQSKKHRLTIEILNKVLKIIPFVKRPLPHLKKKKTVEKKPPKLSWPFERASNIQSLARFCSIVFFQKFPFKTIVLVSLPSNNI